MPSSRTAQPQSQDPSSDWFSSDPAVYIQALDEFEQSLAHQNHQQQTGREQEIQHQVQPPLAAHKRTHGELTGDYLNPHTYGAATFGDFGEYMSRKRAKLQIQNQTLTSGTRLEAGSKIFQGIGIYVRGDPVVRICRFLIKNRLTVLLYLLFKNSARWSSCMVESFTLIWTGSRWCMSPTFGRNALLTPTVRT